MTVEIDNGDTNLKTEVTLSPEMDVYKAIYEAKLSFSLSHLYPALNVDIVAMGDCYVIFDINGLTVNENSAWYTQVKDSKQQVTN